MKIKLTSTVKLLTIKALAILMMITMFAETSFSQTRIRFAKGRSSTTVSGSLGAGGSRQYVLSAIAGQTLSASIRSSNGKVTITLPNGRGTTSDSFETNDGDNYIGIYNSGGAATFTLTVSIR